jgi:hypothetical protein
VSNVFCVRAAFGSYTNDFRPDPQGTGGNDAERAAPLDVGA